MIIYVSVTLGHQPHPHVLFDCRYEWYMELRALHYIHHLGDMKSNLAMLNLGMDGLFGSLGIEAPEESGPGAGVYQAMLRSAGRLPDGVTRHQVFAAGAKHAGAVATILGLDVPLETDPEYRPPRTNQYPTVLLRLLLAMAAVQLWFTTEASAAQYLATKVPPLSL